MRRVMKPFFYAYYSIISRLTEQVKCEIGAKAKGLLI